MEPNSPEIPPFKGGEYRVFSHGVIGTGERWWSIRRSGKKAPGNLRYARPPCGMKLEAGWKDVSAIYLYENRRHHAKDHVGGSLSGWATCVLGGAPSC